MGKKKHDDFSVVKDQQNMLTAEELPEGPYGSPIRKDEPVENKSGPWKEGQQYMSGFVYETRSFHDNLPRQMDGAHPTHDEKDESEE